MPAGASGCSPRSRPSPATTRTRASVYASSASGSRRGRSCVPRDLPRTALGRSTLSARSLRRGEQFAERARALEAEHDRRWSPSVAHWRQVLARVYAHRGELAEAERLAREAVAWSERKRLARRQGYRSVGPGRGSSDGGPPRRGGRRLEQALDHCRRKKNLALAKQGNRQAQLSGEALPGVKKGRGGSAGSVAADRPLPSRIMRPNARRSPAGTVTFMFTDVEGSTRLLHELGAEGYRRTGRAPGVPRAFFERRRRGRHPGGRLLLRVRATAAGPSAVQRWRMTASRRADPRPHRAAHR